MLHVQFHLLDSLNRSTRVTPDKYLILYTTRIISFYFFISFLFFFILVPNRQLKEEKRIE